MCVTIYIYLAAGDPGGHAGPCRPSDWGCPFLIGRVWFVCSVAAVVVVCGLRIVSTLAKFPSAAILNQLPLRRAVILNIT